MDARTCVPEMWRVHSTKASHRQGRLQIRHTFSYVFAGGVGLGHPASDRDRCHAGKIQSLCSALGVVLKRERMSTWCTTKISQKHVPDEWDIYVDVGTPCGAPHFTHLAASERPKPQPPTERCGRPQGGDFRLFIKSSV